MADLLLHVGWPKTGTTSLQAMMRSHPNLAGKPYARPGGDAALEIRRQLVQADAFDPEVLAGHLAAARVDPDRPVIYSDEGCISMPAHHWHRGFQTPDVVAERLAVAASAWDTRVLVTVRDGRGLLRSSYRHAVRNGYSWPYATYLDRIAAEVERGDGVFAAGRILATYRRLFGPGNVAVVPITRLAGGAVWRDAAEALRLPSLTELVGDAPHENRHELGPLRVELFLNRWLLFSKFHPPRGLRRLRVTQFRPRVTDRIPRWGTELRVADRDLAREAAIAARFDAETGLSG